MKTISIITAIIALAATAIGALAAINNLEQDHE